MSATVVTGEPKYAAFVGLDWADKEHAWALEVAGGGEREHGKLEQTPEAIEVWAVQLAARFAGQPVAVGLEQARGALIYALQKYAHLVLYPIHPSTSSSYRAAIFPNGRKNDPVDANLLLDLLTRHRDRLRRQELDSEQTRKLQLLTENRRHLVDQLTAQTNCLTALLKTVFPQVLKWFDKLSSTIAVAFLQRWPTLAHLQPADEETLRKFFHQYGSRSKERIEGRLKELRTMRAAIEDPAILEPCVLMMQALLPVITALREGIAKLEEEAEKVFAAHPDAAIFSSFPGAGAALAPRLLVAFGSHRDRWNSVKEFQPFTGIPPITVQSGKTEYVHFRWACAKFLRQSFHEFAAQSIIQSDWARAFYQHQRNANKLDHHAAVRSLAFKWQRILFACWRNRTAYQETLHQQRLLHRHAVEEQPKKNAAAAESKVKSSRRTSSNPVPFRFKKVGGFWKLSDPTS